LWPTLHALPKPTDFGLEIFLIFDAALLQHRESSVNRLPFPQTQKPENNRVRPRFPQTHPTEPPQSEMQSQFSPLTTTRADMQQTNRTKLPTAPAICTV